jgi:O-antigen/teichoic acid export membrane protein
MNELGNDSARSSGRGKWLAQLLNRYHYAAALIDQVGLSLFNLALTFCLVRVLDANEFGFVSLWLTVAVLLSDMQVPLVGLPLNVHLPRAPDEAAKSRLEGAITAVNFAFVTLAVVAVVAANLFCDGNWVARGWVTGTAIPLCIAVGLRREYCRSLAYCRGDMTMLLLTDIPYIVVTSACLLAMLLWPHHLAGVAEAFIALSAGGIIGQLCLRAAARWRQPSLGREGWVAAYRNILPEVGWALIGVVSTHLQVRSYVYLTTSLVGLAGVAALNAVGVLFRPISTLLTAWSRPTLPKLAAALAKGNFIAFDRMILTGMAVAAVGSAGWCAVLWLIWAPIEIYVLGDKYPDAGRLLLPWAIVTCVVALDQVASVALQAARDFRFLAYVTLISAPVTIVATVGTILWQGYTWAMYGVAIGQVLGLVMVVGRLYSIRRLEGSACPAQARTWKVEITPAEEADGTTSIASLREDASGPDTLAARLPGR